MAKAILQKQKQIYIYLALSWHNRLVWMTKQQSHAILYVEHLWSAACIQGSLWNMAGESARAGERNTFHSTEKILSIVR